MTKTRTRKPTTRYAAAVREAHELMDGGYGLAAAVKFAALNNDVDADRLQTLVLWS